jgi:hypothetical protein
MGTDDENRNIFFQSKQHRSSKSRASWQLRLLAFTPCRKLTKTNNRMLEQNPLMDCSRCGVCCEKTEMLLSNADVKRLEGVGYDRQKFACQDRHGFIRLRNRRGFCVFYDAEERRCRIYKHRPLGCRVYPVIYSEQEGIVLDDLCPMKSTVSKIELKVEGKKLMKLLQRIDTEAVCNRNKTKNMKDVK